VNTLDSALVLSVQERLVAWYRESRRDLPWRTDCDPYRILVSEMMLVQTTVAAVIPYYERFLRRYPTVGALAGATEAEVVKAWEGLGYYRRARQLHAAARQIMEQHGGEVPRDPAAVRALPGVGQYIAGAVLSFAFDHAVPILEANSQRVLARLLAVDAELAKSSTRKRLWDAAERLVPSVGAGAFNQALMDLGALICTPREPRCLICPLTAHCEGRRLGIQNRLPTITPKAAPEKVSEACAIVRAHDRVLIVQRGTDCLWEQFWEFPTIHTSGADPAGRSFGNVVTLAEGVARLTGIRARIGPPAKTVTYSVTNHRVRLLVHLGEPESGSPRPGPGLVHARWVEPAKLPEYTFSSAGRRIIAWLS
jgi:A/G-specific adenine glycosylase